MLDTFLLEEIAMKLREKLGIPQNIIINPDYLERLCESVESKLEGFKIKKDSGSSWLLLEEGKFFTIHIQGNREQQFYNLVEQLIFAIMLDKDTLNGYELRRKEFLFPRMTNDEGASSYVMMAFMMPRRAFLLTLNKYSSGDGSRVYMQTMQKEVNKYCYKRGSDLKLW